VLEREPCGCLRPVSLTAPARSANRPRCQAVAFRSATVCWYISLARFPHPPPLPAITA